MSRRDSREGEISDGDSLEEITAEDFEHDARRSSRSRVWMQDLMRHRLPRGYEACLYNFAWAQAAQNRPLGIGLPVADLEDVVAEESGEKVGGEEDDEKEDGELEEGEIELGSEPMELDGAIDSSNDKMGKKIEVIELTENKIEEIGEFDKRVSLILEELETVTEEDAKASLETVCVRLRKSFESLKLMHSDSGLPVLSALVQQAFMGMQTVHSVVIASNTKKNEDLLLRLLIHIRNQYSILLTADQLKELDGMVQSLVSSDSKGSSTSSLSSHAAVSSSNLSTSGKGNSWSRMDFSPLLDLHADYDEGSLPSPTRENAPPLPSQKPVGFGMAQPVPVGFGMAQPVHSKNVKPEIDAFQPYDPEAFKAVSSYQQKYKTSFPASNRLPSPTPSEDGDCDDDIQGEVSSSPVLDNARVVNSSSSSQLLWSGFSGARTPSASGLQIPPLTTAVRAPGKSRDPRLRVLNPEVSGTSDQNRLPLPVEASSPIGFSGSLVNPRKHKATELLLDNRPLKRERNGFVNSRDVQMAPGSSVLASQSTSNFNLMNSGIGQNPSVASVPAVSTSTASAVSLPSLFKDMAVNPTMIMQLFQMKQQRLAEQSQQKTTDPACNPILNPNANRFPGPVSAENGASLKTSEREHNSAERSQLPAQTVSLNVQSDVGRIRMKPRDPRRILHNNTAVKIESSKFGSANVNGTSDTLSSKDILKVREQGEQAQTAGLPSQPALQPDIARLFTKNLKNVADMISSTLSANTSSAVPQDTSQPIPHMINKADVVALAVDLNGQKNVSGLPRERSAVGASQEPNPWGDVDHLLDGYDDQQKAAIQRERARRIEEQNKMFAARKLCLVLDLDHTLLNSAKFIEVDPIHDEILRKKEEQDREKPQRHLFRFPHMGMWTKLRPGIWNFLERATKLFELHLYTMGNKLYATEMAKVLDPTGTLFAGRVISRGDDNDPLDGDERVPKSKDLDGVLGMESAVVIIDDSVRVWPHNKLNLIIVERYTYFPCSRRQFGLPGPSLLEIDHDERPEAGTLASSLAVIERLHSIFFSNRSLNDVDVRNILAAEQRKILAGCRVVFSRIFPVGEASPHLHPLWQTAEQFGAVCTNFIDEQVTHVVANSPGTDKVNWALSTGRFVVQPGWVEASALLYRRANEHEFAIKI